MEAVPSHIKPFVGGQPQVYSIWVVRVKSALAINDLDGFADLSETKPEYHYGHTYGEEVKIWTQRDHKARGIVLNLLDDEILNSFNPAWLVSTTCAGLFEELDKRYRTDRESQFQIGLGK